MRTFRLVLGGVLTLIPFVLLAHEISKVGLRAWLRATSPQTGFEWLGSYFPRGLKTIGPLIYLFLVIWCFYKRSD